MPRSQTIRIFTISIVLLLLFSAAYGVMLTRIRGHAQALSELQAQVAAAQQSEERNTSMREVLEDTQESRANLNRYVASKDNAAAFIDTIESLEEPSGTAITISSVELATVENTHESDQEQEKSSPPVSQLNVQLRAEGGFRSVYHLTTLLEQLPYVHEIQTLSFERTSEGGEVGTPWRVIVTLSATAL